MRARSSTAAFVVSTVAFVVLAAVRGPTGVVVEEFFGVRTPGAFGVAQLHVWALAGLLPLLATGTALSLWRPAERVSRLPLAGRIPVIITIFRGGRLPSKVRRA